MAERNAASSNPEFVTVTETLENGDLIHRQAVRVPLVDIFELEEVEK